MSDSIHFHEVVLSPAGIMKDNPFGIGLSRVVAMGRLRQITDATDPAGRDIQDEVASFPGLPLGRD